MYDELVKRLRRYVEIERSEHHGAELEAEAADAIEELSKPRWIPVTERLPENWRSVLVFCVLGEANWIQIADVVRGKWRLLPEFSDGIVTHWMPLPEPPKEE